MSETAEQINHWFSQVVFSWATASRLTPTEDCLPHFDNKVVKTVKMQLVQVSLMLITQQTCSIQNTLALLLALMKWLNQVLKLDYG